MSFILHGLAVLLIAFWPMGEAPQRKLLDMPVLDLQQVTIGGPASTSNPNALKGTGTPAAKGQSKSPIDSAPAVPTLDSLESDEAKAAAEAAKKAAADEAAQKKAAEDAAKKAAAEEAAKIKALEDAAKKKAADEVAKKKAAEDAAKKKTADEAAKKKAAEDAAKKKAADEAAKKKAAEDAAKKKKAADEAAKKKAAADAAKKKAKADADAKAAADKAVLDAALAQALIEAGGDPTGAGGTIDGATGTGTVGQGSGDGIGVLGSYVDSCISRIRPNFTTSPRADHKVFTVTVSIDIAPDGRITDTRVVAPSGDGSFDASVIQAIRVTEFLERPPRPQDQRVTLTFNSDMGGGM